MITVTLQEFVRHPAQYVEQVKRNHEVVAVFQEGREVVRLVSPEAGQRLDEARARLRAWAVDAEIGDVISHIDEQDRAVVQLVSPNRKKGAPDIEALRRKYRGAKIGDVLSPIDEEWDACR